MSEALVSRERFWYGDLPPVCVKTGLPADGTVKASFDRMPPWTFLLLFAGIFPFFIAALFVRDRVDGRIPVTAEAVERYHADRKWLWAAWGLIAAGVVVPVVLLQPGWLVLVAAGLLLLAAIEIRRSRNWITGVPVHGTPFVELRRVHPAFADAVAAARTRD